MNLMHLEKLTVAQLERKFLAFYRTPYVHRLVQNSTLLFRTLILISPQTLALLTLCFRGITIYT